MQSPSCVDNHFIHNTYRSPEDQWYNVPSSSSTSSNGGCPSRDLYLSRFSSIDAIRPLPRVPTPCARVPRPLPTVPQCAPRPPRRRPLPVPTIQPEQRVTPTETEKPQWVDCLSVSPEPLEPVSPLCLDDNDGTSSETSEETEGPEESEECPLRPIERPIDMPADASSTPMEIVLYGPSNGYEAVHFQTHSYREECLKISESGVAFVDDGDDMESFETSECTAPPSYHGFPFQASQSRYFSEKSQGWAEESKTRTHMTMKGLFTRKWVLEKKGRRYELEDDYQKILGALRRL